MKLFLCLLAVWGSVGAAISVALYYTHDMRCLWFFIIPLFVNIKFERQKDGKESKEE